MKKIVLTLLLAAASLAAGAQTAREFTLPMTPAGARQLVVWLAGHPIR